MEISADSKFFDVGQQIRAITRHAITRLTAVLCSLLLVIKSTAGCV
jgi:hypothetical protein